ncbi:MAG TPA: N-acetylneuraminate synthase family protein [Candidatus Acidoferrales bacterium]|nr:N-acetylneuraminate synthase family protein [Candidatus Acidoferrales bacterium]
MPSFKIGERTIGEGAPVYFIADISANHDGSIERARKLIRLAKQAGANGAKFQHFRASKIVSDCGFRSLGAQLSHQAKWRKPVFDVYDQASLPWEWTADLKACCDEEGIDFFSTPYDFEAANMLDPYVQVYKVGSGDITWPEMLAHVGSKKKPVILSTGASNMADVQRAIQTVRAINPHIALLQCNTNYTGTTESLNHIHLNVLRTYSSAFPDVVLGLSDHTAGHATVLGAVALGATIIEKHFTDDITREGPDHPFSMNPQSWAEMVERTRELERALGSADKFVAENESETVIVQRRCLRAAAELEAGKMIERSDIDVLRPAPPDAISPYEIDKVVGRRLLLPVSKGQQIAWNMLAHDRVSHTVTDGYVVQTELSFEQVGAGAPVRRTQEN